jgi:hypothetical protein
MTIPGRIATALAFAVLLTASGIFLSFLRSANPTRTEVVGPSLESAAVTDQQAPLLREGNSSFVVHRPPKESRSHLPQALQVRARFLRLARQNGYLAIDSALRLTGSHRRTALATLAKEFGRDFQLERQGLAKILERIVAHSRRNEAGDRADRTSENRDTIAMVLATQSGAAFVTARLANRLLDGDRRAEILHLAGVACVATDPGLALALGSSLTGDAHNDFLAEFARTWAQTAPEAAAKWASSIPDTGLRSSVLREAMTSFTRPDPQKAADWAAALPAGDSRRLALKELGAIWGRKDTAAALDWTQQLPDPTERQEALTAIRSVAPIGVGLEISRREESGYPVAMNLIPSGPAAQSGSVKRGEQIVAVSNSGSQWVDTRNLTIDQVVSQIRGNPGQPVQLRLLPPGVTDPNQARTVTIVRQQLLFKEAL